MITVTAFASIGFFIFALRIFGVARVGSDVLGTVKGAIATIRDSSLDDVTREKELQHHSLKLVGAFFSILIRSGLTFLTSFLPIWFASSMGVARTEDVIQYLTRWDVIVAITVLVGIGYGIFIRLRSSSTMAFQINYSALDRLLHWVAFSTPSVQLTAADIEKKVLGAAYTKVQVDRPICITSLPRAGTTIILEALCRFPSLATHTYRDMPFVMAPVLWSRLSGRFRKRSELFERAHGDGIQFGYDSPEAFEEVFWRTFWPKKYTNDNVLLSSEDDYNDEARTFFVELMKKIIALRRPDRTNNSFYISKNNGNMARIDLIIRMFPDAKILVPVRHPTEHAASLHRQHCNFIEMHRSEPFIRRYMADIGHYEFGELHRPIAFPGIEKLLFDRDPLTMDYWLAYWIAAFEHVVARSDKVMLISYEATCSDGRRALADICEQLEIRAEGMLDDAAMLFNAPEPRQYDKANFNPELLSRAEGLHRALIGR